MFIKWKKKSLYGLRFFLIAPTIVPVAIIAFIACAKAQEENLEQVKVENYFKENLKKSYTTQNKSLDLWSQWTYQDLKINYVFEKFKEDLNKLYGLKLDFNIRVDFLRTDIYDGKVFIWFEVKNNEQKIIYKYRFIVDGFDLPYKNFINKLKNSYSTTKTKTEIEEIFKIAVSGKKLNKDESSDLIFNKIKLDDFPSFFDSLIIEVQIVYSIIDPQRGWGISFNLTTSIDGAYEKIKYIQIIGGLPTI